MSVVVAFCLCVSIFVFLSLCVYLRFCRFVVTQTGGSEGLRDVAVAMRAFATLPRTVHLPGRARPQ